MYRDGSDEWIEVLNLGPDDFSGSISFSGVASSLQTIPSFQLSAGDYKVIADSDDFFVSGANVLLP